MSFGESTLETSLGRQVLAKMNLCKLLCGQRQGDMTSRAALRTVNVHIVNIDIIVISVHEKKNGKKRRCYFLFDTNRQLHNQG